MALNSFNAYHSYLKSIEPLNDAERGRLFTALLEYSSTGAEPELCGNERYIFPTMKEQIDRDKASYEAKCAKNRENGAKGGQATANRSLPNAPRSGANAPQRQGQGQGQRQGQTLSGNSARGAQEPPKVSDYGFSPELEAAVTDWLTYKQERRESYKPTGLKSMLTQVKNAAAEHGDAAVVGIIRDSMASGYQGIIFDRLKKGGAAFGARGTATEGAKPKRNWGITYDV